MFRTLINAFKNKEIRNKLLITIALLFLYRIGCWLPVPGIDREVFSYVDGNNTLLSLLSAITSSAPFWLSVFLRISMRPLLCNCWALSFPLSKN